MKMMWNGRKLQNSYKMWWLFSENKKTVFFSLSQSIFKTELYANVF